MANLSYDQLILKADAYRKNDNRRLASLHYRKALDKKPDSLVAAIGLSKLLVREGQLEEAFQLLLYALENDESNVPALLLMGCIARDRGDLTGSLEWLTKAYSKSPADPEVLTELAITNDHIGQERLTYAEPLYKKVISLKTHSSAAHNNLGFNYLLQGRHADAAKAFNRALVLAPDNKRAKNNLAAAYLLNEQTDEALKLFQDTVGLAAAYNNLGYILMTRGDWPQAKKAFKKALQLNPSFYVRAQENLDHLEHLHSNAR
jgi:Flp pilus assembly protein TadD